MRRVTKARRSDGVALISAEAKRARLRTSLRRGAYRREKERENARRPGLFFYFAVFHKSISRANFVNARRKIRLGAVWKLITHPTKTKASRTEETRLRRLQIVDV